MFLLVVKIVHSRPRQLNPVLLIGHTHLPSEGCNWLSRGDGWCHWCFPLRCSRNGVNLAPHWAISVRPHPMKDTLVRHPTPPSLLSSILTPSLPAASSHLPHSANHLLYIIKAPHLHLFAALYITGPFCRIISQPPMSYNNSDKAMSQKGKLDSHVIQRKV